MLLQVIRLLKWVLWLFSLLFVRSLWISQRRVPLLEEGRLENLSPIQPFQSVRELFSLNDISLSFFNMFLISSIFSSSRSLQAPAKAVRGLFLTSLFTVLEKLSPRCFSALSFS